MLSRESLLEDLNRRVEELSINIERLNLAEYLEVWRNPRRLLYLNFISGIARGFGMAIGFSILGAIALYVLQRIVVLRLPIIGDFIADIVRIVQDELTQ